jgi:hypothetical protein
VKAVTKLHYCNPTSTQRGIRALDFGMLLISFRWDVTFGRHCHFMKPKTSGTKRQAAKTTGNKATRRPLHFGKAVEPFVRSFKAWKQ